ncbi:IclR family transcriptional regulator [Actinomadura barringtoniae]|uniref:Glycerol operon regulatory protein n=1 Tax=Actinomadura barringtoniae TaxID=1427535 RepID=A0A939P9G0_9ACTN|nr:IclR family transcriptional regulator [Actinomadura barringtoniae]MBO2448587.1 IclR family transcriptional regulator [Actinomadura barringtoniae]
MSTESEVCVPPRKQGTQGPADGQGRSNDGYHVGALAKGLRLLELFSEQRPSMKLTDMAAETGLPLPTAFRMAATLASEGFLEQLPDGAYRPAPKVLTLGFSALRSLDLVQLAAAPLHRLVEATGQTVNLGVLSGDQVLYLVRLRNNDLVTANIQVGSRLPAVRTSMGKLLLAHLDAGELDKLLTEASFGGAAGPNAVRSLDELRPALAETRERGWAVQDEELAYGLRSVAGPVRGASGAVVAAVNVAVPATQVSTSELLDEVRPLVQETCAEISRLLGAP